MVRKISVAVLGSTGYVGLELVKILSKHPNVKIEFLGSENSAKMNISDFDKSLVKFNLPLIDYNSSFIPENYDFVFLALPHGISNKFVKNYFNKIKIIDLSADFRLNDIHEYKKNYAEIHYCPELLKEFKYGLTEIYRDQLVNANNIAIPGCYPTSILIPLIPLLKNNFIKNNNIIIDSKSGYSGAGKKFNYNNLKNENDFNFYNYNTNSHRHISEIQQELNLASSSTVLFSFNPHILPNFRGMMSTIYCDLNESINFNNIEDLLLTFSKKNSFINYYIDQQADFFSVQNTNKCILKIFKHYDDRKIIVVSLIDNLVKGAAGQAVQCFNASIGVDETISLI